jgi:hypothetical protein
VPMHIATDFDRGRMTRTSDRRRSPAKGPAGTISLRRRLASGGQGANRAKANHDKDWSKVYHEAR